MIELIFVIVILGILAAVAIPKLAATRDDAKVSAEMEGVATALKNLGAEYVAQGAFNNYTIAEANAAVECFTFANPNAGDVTVTAIAAASNTCPAAVLTTVTTRAAANGITGVTHEFGGTGVVY